MIWLSGGRLVLLDDNGNPFRKGWNDRERSVCWVVIKHHREHGPGSVGLRMESVGFCVADVDSGLEDAERLEKIHGPFFSYQSRNGRGKHLGFDLPATLMKERTGIPWAGAIVDYKAIGLCRTPDEALCRIASALVRRADGEEVPALPETFLDAYEEAGRCKVEDETSTESTTTESPSAESPSAESKAASKAVRICGRGTPLSGQPAPAARIENARTGQRNTTMYYRSRWWMGRRAPEFATYAEFEEHCLPIVFEAAMRMAEPEETDQKIIASIRSALGWGWRKFGGASGSAPPIPATVSDPDPAERAWIAGQRRRSQLGGEATARVLQAQCDERYARILEVDATTRTVAETAAAAGVCQRTVQRARKAAAPEADGTKNTPTTTPAPPMPFRRVSPRRIFRTPPSGRGRGRPRAISPKREREVWRAHDGGMGLRRLAERYGLPRSTVQGIVARKPLAGQGAIDSSIRGLALALRKEFGGPHLGGIASAIERRHGVRLPTGVIRAWLALEPGPDYVREDEARAAARAARRPRPPVAPEVRAVRSTLRLVPGCSLTLVEVVHAELSQVVLEAEHRRALRGWQWRRAA